MSTEVGALILAAGFSNRFGSLKLCARLDNGRTVFQQTLDRIQQAVGQVIVITRPELATELEAGSTQIQVFPQAERGMGATLAFGIGFAGDWDACLVCLADMPFIESATYRLLAGALSDSNIIVPTHGARSGNPVGFGRRFYPELARLSGDAGGRPVLRAHPEAVMQLEVADPAILSDIDTPEDLARYQQGSVP